MSTTVRDNAKWTVSRALGLPVDDIESALVALDDEEARLRGDLVRLQTARGVLLTRLGQPPSVSVDAADLTEAARILGESEDWVKHHGHEADEYGAAIRMGGGRISGYDREGLLRWRRARTRNADKWTTTTVPIRAPWSRGPC